MKTKSYPLRIPEGVLEIAKLRSSEEHVDQSTAMRQLLHLGAEEYIIKLIADGRLSIGKAAELLGITIYDIYRFAEKHGVTLGATEEQHEEGQKTADKLFRT